jgi:serine/threonine protein kinase
MNFEKIFLSIRLSANSFLLIAPIEQPKRAKTQKDALQLLMETLNEASDVTTEGMMVDDYKILKRIGRGAFGVVYHAVHVRTNESVAIKSLDLNDKMVCHLF